MMSASVRVFTTGHAYLAGGVNQYGHLLASVPGHQGTLFLIHNHSSLSLGLKDTEMFSMTQLPNKIHCYSLLKTASTSYQTVYSN